MKSGDLLRIKDGLGTMEITYNSTHDATSSKDRRGKITTYTYNTYGQVTSITDPLNVTTDYIYNADQRLTEIKRDNLTQVQYTYDPIGRVDSVTDASGMTMDYTYDDLDRMAAVGYPDGKSVEYEHGPPCCSSQMASVTDRAGRTTYYEYNSRKLRTAMTNPEGGITRFEYDLNGNLTRLVDPNNNTTTFEYDLSDRLVKKIYADGKFVAFSYNAASLLASHTNARGTTTSYYYDENSNMTTIEYDDDTPGVIYYYDDYNRMTSMDDATGTYAYTYNENGQVLSIDGPWANDTITYSYDDLGRRTGMTPDGGQVRNYQYDPLNRLEQITAGTQTFTYGYSGANPLVQTLTRPNGSVTDYQYDNLNRLTEVENKNSAAAIINKYVYTYNNEDQRDSETITNGLAITSFQEGLVQNDYNEVNQILSATNPQRTFMHDDDGNLTVGYTPDGYEFTAQYDAENRLKQIEYTDDQGKVHKREYIYRGDWLLAQIKKYEDDVLMDDTRMVRDGFLVLQERDANNAVTRQYTWGQNMGGGIGGLLSLSKDGQDYSYLYDGKGNVTSVIDSSQSPVATYTYDPFGKLMIQAGTLQQPFQFSTKRYDAGTGLNYYGYRFYAPVLGRWINRDPIGVAGGINLYSFVENNPVNWVDPFGDIGLPGAFGGAIGGFIGGGAVGGVTGGGVGAVSGAVTGGIIGGVVGFLTGPVGGINAGTIGSGIVTGILGEISGPADLGDGTLPGDPDCP